jgi:hypothetical protein
MNDQAFSMRLIVSENVLSDFTAQRKKIQWVFLFPRPATADHFPLMLDN